MTAPRLALGVVALTALGGQARADANALNDSLGPRELAVGESMRADAKGGLAVTLNPAGLALSRTLVFEGGYGHRGGDGADTVAVSACDSTVPVPGCFYYHYVAADPSISGIGYSRRAHEFGVSLARVLGERVILGTTTKYFDYDSDLTGEEDGSGFNFDAGVIMRATQTASLAFVGYNLVGEDSANYPRAIAGGLSFRPSEQLGIALDGLWNLELPEGSSTGRYGGGAEYFATSGDQLTGYPIRAGVVYDNAIGGTYITGGLGFISAKLGIDVGFRKQVDGGDELMVQGSLRVFGPTDR